MSRLDAAKSSTPAAATTPTWDDQGYTNHILHEDSTIDMSPFKKSRADIHSFSSAPFGCQRAYFFVEGIPCIALTAWGVTPPVAQLTGALDTTTASPRPHLRSP